MRKIFLMVFIIGVFFINFIPNQSNAESTVEAGQSSNGNNKIFLENIDGMKDLNKKMQSSDNATDPGELITLYLEWLIRLSVVLGSILAVAMIMVGGAQYMTTDVVSGKSKGKERIKNAVMGLIFLIVGYLLFTEINPQILKLDFNYKPTEKGDAVDGGTGGAIEVSGSDYSGDEFDYTNISIDDNFTGPKEGTKPSKEQKPEEVKKTQDGVNGSSACNGNLFKNAEEATKGKDFGINTKLRIAHFLSQVAHESGNFTILVEKGYSLKRAKEVFTKQKYQKCLTTDNPDAIFNCVYGGRLGNNTSGDGSKYKGRGLLQITGKVNYQKFTKWHLDTFGEDVNFVNDPEKVATYPYTIRSALYYWSTRHINPVADGGSSDAVVKAVTKKVNGGYNGLKDRQNKFKEYYNKCKTVNLNGGGQQNGSLGNPGSINDNNNIDPHGCSINEYWDEDYQQCLTQ